MVNIFGKVKEKVADYVDVKVKMMKLTFIEHVSNVMSYLLYIIVILFILLAIFIFFGIGLGEYMTEVVDSRAGGFLITSGIYVLLILLFVALRKHILRLFSGLFINVLTSASEDDDGEDEAEDKSH